MSEICYKCKNMIELKEQSINCDGHECEKSFHRNCVDIEDDNVYDAIKNNPLLNFYCDQCNFTQMIVNKLENMEEKLNKLNIGLNTLHARYLQQMFAQHTNNQLNAFDCNTNNLRRNNYNGNSNSNNSNHHNLSNNMIYNNNMHSNLIVIGNNTNLQRLQVVCDYGRWVQVGKFATTTSEEDVIDHISDEIKINRNLIKCTKLVKNDANLAQLQYCKFKISIPDYRFNELFNEAIWPSGVMVCPFTPRSQMNPNRI